LFHYRVEPSNDHWQRDLDRARQAIVELLPKEIHVLVESRFQCNTRAEALTSLVDARNDFAHGGSPTITFGDVQLYFGHARIIVEQIDGIVG
jgi:hypothetical protein